MFASNFESKVSFLAEKSKCSVIIVNWNSKWCTLLDFNNSGCLTKWMSTYVRIQTLELNRNSKIREFWMHNWMHVLTCSISLAWSNLQWSQNGLVLPYMNISHANKTKLAAERAERIQMLTGRSPMAPTTIDSKNCIRFGPSELIPRHLQIRTKFRDKPSRGFRLEPIRGKPDFLSRRRARLRTSARFRDSSARREIT